MPIKHAFTSGKPDGGDATQVRASDWNAAHAISGLGLTTIAPTSDTYVNSESPTTNSDTTSTLTLRNTWGTSSFTRFVPHTWNISSLAGLVVARAEIVIVASASDGTQTDGRTMAVLPSTLA